MEYLVAAFEKNIFQPKQQEFIGRTNSQLRQQASRLQKKITQAMKELLLEPHAAPVAAVSVTLLYSSVALGKPVFRVDCFAHKAEAPMNSYELPADWLFADWSEFKEQLMEESREMRRAIREPEVESFMWQSVRMLVYLAAAYWKYWLRDLLSEVSNLLPAPEVKLFFGEYSGWCELSAAKLPALELTAGKKQDFSHRRFVDQSYHGLVLDACDFRAAVFQNCRFEGCHFANCDFRDTSFQNCRFFDGSFTAGVAAGSDWQACSFYAIEFSEMQTDQLPQLEIFRPARGIDCEFIQTKAFDCVDWQTAEI